MNYIKHRFAVPALLLIAFLLAGCGVALETLPLEDSRPAVSTKDAASELPQVSEPAQNTQERETTPGQTLPEEPETQWYTGIETLPYPNFAACYALEQMTEAQKNAYYLFARVMADIERDGVQPGKVHPFDAPIAFEDVKLAIDVLSGDFRDLYNATVNYTDFVWDEHADMEYLLAVAETDVSYAVRDFQNRLQEYRTVVEKADDILASLEHDGTEPGKAFAIYKWLAENVRYDHTLKNASTVHALVDRNVVCSGYASAFDLMAKRAGLDSIIVKGRGGSEAHEWNMIRTGGQWYHIDATWGSNGEYYKYFMMPDALCQVFGYQGYSYYTLPSGGGAVCPLANSYKLYQGYFAKAEDVITYLSNCDVEAYHTKAGIHTVVFDDAVQSLLFAEYNETAIKCADGKNYRIIVYEISEGIFYCGLTTFTDTILK